MDRKEAIGSNDKQGRYAGADQKDDTKEKLFYPDCWLLHGQRKILSYMLFQKKKWERTVCGSF